MDTFDTKESTAVSAVYTAIVVAVGATGLIVWRTLLGHDDAILRLLRHFF